MHVGDPLKVSLGGEAPWAIITAILSDDRVMARINNHTVMREEHGLGYGGVATFDLIEVAPDCFIWAIASKQAPNGPRPLE